MGKRKRKVRFLKPCNMSKRLGKKIGRALAGVVDTVPMMGVEVLAHGVVTPGSMSLRALTIGTYVNPAYAAPPVSFGDIVRTALKIAEEFPPGPIPDPPYTYRTRAYEMRPSSPLIREHLLGLTVVQEVGVDPGQSGGQDLPQPIGSTEPDTGRSE